MEARLQLLQKVFESPARWLRRVLFLVQQVVHHPRELDRPLPISLAQAEKVPVQCNPFNHGGFVLPNLAFARGAWPTRVSPLPLACSSSSTAPTGRPTSKHTSHSWTTAKHPGVRTPGRNATKPSAPCATCCSTSRTCTAGSPAEHARSSAAVPRTGQSQRRCPARSEDGPTPRAAKQLA